MPNDPKKPLEGLKVLVTGGTGSLGQRLVRRLLTGEIGLPDKIIVFSRDEAKQHQMRLDLKTVRVTTDEIIYRDALSRVAFRIGDVRNFDSLVLAMQDATVVINAAALKQVPTCEYAPFEAVRTNVYGAHQIVGAALYSQAVGTVVGISTDKACKPVNVMGMTKALQERIFIQANMEMPTTRFVCVRYGNVLASRGSVVPLFLDQIAAGGPVTVTDNRMTRFLLTLDSAVDTVFAALIHANRGEIYVPRVPAARMLEVAQALIGDKGTKIDITGIRPGEKLHEQLVSEEEWPRTIRRGDYFVIRPMLPEVACLGNGGEPAGIGNGYSSEHVTIEGEALARLLDPAIMQLEAARQH